MGGCRVWAGLVPGEQGAASSGPGTGTQYPLPGPRNTTRGCMGANCQAFTHGSRGKGGGGGLQQDTYLFCYASWFVCRSVRSLSMRLTIKSFGTITADIYLCDGGCNCITFPLWARNVTPRCCHKISPYGRREQDMFWSPTLCFVLRAGESGVGQGNYWLFDP